MIEGKKDYDAIKVPDTLSDVLDKACIRGRNHMMKRRMKNIGIGLAACLCVVMMSNNQTTYAALSNIPIVGQIVNVLHFGSSGKITDGASVHTDLNENLLKIWFENDEKLLDMSPYYNIEKLTAPNRLMITIHGARKMEMEKFIKDASSIEGVKDAYQIIALDDSIFEFVIELNSNIDYKVTEYADPGYLELSFNKMDNLVEEQEVYFLRTESMEMGEAIAQIAELYMDEGSNIVKTLDGKYSVVIGEFDSKEEAEKKKMQIEEKYSDSELLYVDNCLNGENPR